MAKSKAGMSANQSAEAVTENRGRPSTDDRRAAPVAKATKPAARPMTPRDTRQPLPASDGGQGDATAITPGGDVGLKEREEMIRMAAYERYVQRGGEGGSAIDDWLQAEAAIDSPGRQTDQQREKP